MGRPVQPHCGQGRVVSVRRHLQRRHDDPVHKVIGTAFVGSRDIRLNRKQCPCHRCHQPTILQWHSKVDVVGWSAAHHVGHAMSHPGQHSTLVNPTTLTNTGEARGKRPERVVTGIMHALRCLISVRTSDAHVHASSHPPPAPDKLAKHQSASLDALQDGKEVQAPVGEHERPWEANANRFCYLMTVSYDGTDFYGYQIQCGRRTVARELQRMLCTIFQVEPASLNMNASGRTDTGVHAMQQHVQFYLDHEITAPDATPSRLNRVLPPDIRVHQLQQAPTSFSVRLHATWREYWYRLSWGNVYDPIKRRHMAFVFGDLDMSAMIETLECMVGTHDFEAFSNFTHDGASTVRTISKAQLVMVGPCEARFEVRGSGFLHKMVRHIVGAVIAVGQGKITTGYIQDLLNGAVPEGMYAGGFRGWHVADACGLHKAGVEFQHGSLDL
eukprot:jgi/Ulvmu1/12857/UM098_0042.1